MTHNCYTCNFRKDVPGSCHSRCTATGKPNLDFLLSLQVVSGVQFAGVKFNPHGVNSGWCTWPIDFDPVWVEQCGLYKKKEEV